MSETPEEKPAGAPEEKPTEAKPTPSETDWKAEARKWEQRAKENSEAAKKLADIEEASKSELEKAKERAAAAEQRATQAEQTALKVRIATELGVIPEVVQGSTEDEMRASAQRVLEWANANKRPAPKVPSLKSGASTPEPNSGEKGRAAAAVRALRQG